MLKARLASLGLWLSANIFLGVLVLFIASQSVQAQWTTNGNNINNTNTGNVGIGTTAAQAKLEVHHTSATTNPVNVTYADIPFAVRNTNTTNGNFNIISFLDANGWGNVHLGAVQVDHTAHTGDFFLSTRNNNNFSEKMRIKADGKVGFGTSSPSEYLTTVANDSVNNAITHVLTVGHNPSGAPAAGLGSSLMFRSKRSDGLLGTTGYIASVWEDPTTGTEDGAILFATMLNSGGFGTERMRITSTGNVGVGTSSPLALLNVAGSNSTYSPTGNAVFRIDNSSATGQSPFDFFVNGTLRGRLRSDYAGNLNYVANGGDHYFFVGGDYTVGTPAMIVRSTGLVGIGTTGPTYSLDVNGGVNGFRAKAATTSSGDAIATFENSGGIQAIVRGNGNVGIGTTAPATKLHVNGDVTVSGNIAAKYQDVAEWVPAARALPAGTVVTLNPDQSNLVEASSKAYDTGVAGVISAQPGITLGERSENKVLVATTGRVRVKVDATNAPIRVGDLLVTSEQEGVAMKSQPIDVGGVKIHRPGTIIGKALEPLANGTGEILVLLSLQ
jgi:hypothetical protein